MASSLERLNEDILVQIYEILFPDMGLRPLSLSCKSIRESCLPTLFRASYCGPHFCTWERFIPCSIWPYVRRLSIYGDWQYIDPARLDPDQVPIPLSDALSRLHNVSEVAICNSHGQGIPRTALSIIFSLPELRVLEFDDNMHHGASQLMAPTGLTFPVAPLICLRQVLRDWRLQPRCVPGDMELLRYFASQPQLQQSLETLVIPSENAPLDEFAVHDWPRLKVLSLRGERQPPATPLISAFGRMPALRELTLEVACAPEVGPTRFCPPGWTGPNPWPELESLVVSQPHPDDQLYAYLPDTLRRLALKCWPRRYVSLLSHEWRYVTTMGWYSPILSSSEMLQILSQCHSPSLQEVELEFEEDEHDSELFSLIPVAYPNLVSLTIFRYRTWGAPQVPVREIGRALSSLDNLRTVYLHLDFKDAPHPYAWCNDTGEEEFARFEATLHKAAAVLARELGNSVKVVCLLLRRLSRNKWLPFRIARTGDVVSVQSDRDYASELGVREDDEPGPPYFTHFSGHYYVDNDR